MSDTKEPRITVPRLAEAMRNHMQMKEKFITVMEQADLSEKAVDNLFNWLEEWRTASAQREIRAKEEAMRALQAEIESLRLVAGEA